MVRGREKLNSIHAGDMTSSKTSNCSEPDCLFSRIGRRTQAGDVCRSILQRWTKCKGKRHLLVTGR